MDSKIRYVKTYVDVVVRMRTDGTNIPIKVIWDDQEYNIDKVLRVMSAPTKTSGSYRRTYVPLFACGIFRLNHYLHYTYL